MAKHVTSPLWGLNSIWTMNPESPVHGLNERLPGAIGDIAGHVTGLEGEAIVRPLYHGLGGVDLLGEARWRRLHINDDGVFHVDQVIEGTSKNW